MKVPPSDEDETYSVTAVRLGRWEGGTMQAVISRNSLMSHPEDEAQILALAADHTANKVSFNKDYWCQRKELLSIR